MLEDRDYMRAPGRRLPWSMTAIVSAVLVVVFVLQCVNAAYIHSAAESWLALTRACFTRGWLWQLITFQFLHGGVLHLAFNVITFWFIGRFVEHVLGRRRFLVALFGCGVVGGILQGMLMALFPHHFGTIALGVSAGVSGLFAILALLERDSVMRLFFILPIRSMTLLWAFGIYSLLFTLLPDADPLGLANPAHLGGMLAGIAWVKLGWHRDYVRLPWERLWDHWRQWQQFQTQQRRRELVKTAPVNAPRRQRARPEKPADLPSEEFISREVDPILDKISAHGIQSLTERERKILEAARNKMAKR